MLKFAKFIGANTDFSTAQAFLFPRVFQSGSGDPVFGLVISAEGDDVFIAVKQKILNLEEDFNASFERVTDKLHELLEKLKSEFKDLENLKVTIFCAKEDIFYVLQLGNNLVEILRDGQRMPVLQGDAAQEKIVSGFIKTGDRILVLASRSDNSPWSPEVISEVFFAPLDSIADAEVIFVQGEQKTESQEDLAGVKQIQPVAFILIENGESETEKPEAAASQEKPKREVRLKLEFGRVLLNSRKIIRQGFGMFRRVNKKLLIALVAAVLLIGLASGGFFYYRSSVSAKNARRDNLVFLIDNILNQAQSLKDSDSKAAAAQLNMAQEKLRELESLDPKNLAVSETRKKYEEKSAEVLKIYKNFDLELFMSLDLIKQSFQTKRLSFSVGKVLLLDDNEKSLVALDLKLKTPQIMAGNQQLGGGQLASINGSDAFVYSPDKGLIHIDTDTEKLAVVSKPDEGWGQIQDIFGFSGNIYVLDSGNPPSATRRSGMIWKYVPTDSGFSQKQKYLRGEADLSSGKRLVIDYSVWVLTSEPDILKFTAGNSDFYAISGLDQPLTQIDGLFITEELDSVFILDKPNNRILVTKKNGEYLAQYVNPDFLKVDDFFVDEEGKSIYLLIENKIYKTPLR